MNKLLILFPVLIILLTQSCEKETLYNERQLVINEFFTANEPFTIEITESSGSFDTNMFVLPSDLEVIIYEGDEELGNLYYTVLPAFHDFQRYELFPMSNRIFYTNTSLKPESGKEYTVKAFRNNKLLATAKNTIPQPATITKVDTFSTYSILAGIEVPMLTFNLHFQDNKSTSDFYALTYIMIENHSDTLIAHYQGAGIYSTEAISEYSYEYRNDSGITCKYLLFNDELINGNEVNFSFEIINVWSTGRMDNFKNAIRIYLYSISKEYYEYAKSYNIQQKLKEDLYSEPISMYTNIDGGRGIFAGCSYDSFFMHLPDTYYDYGYD